MATAKAMVAMITTFWNFGVTRMLKNLYAAKVTAGSGEGSDHRLHDDAVVQLTRRSC